MLTATYSMVAMATEQDKVCNFLVRARQAIAALWTNMQEIDLDRLQTAMSGLIRLDQYFHQRKVEKYVIPAVRGSSQEIDALVGDLDSLSGVGLRLLSTAADQLRNAVERHATQARELCCAMDSYCDCLQQRLRREDEELLPLVRRKLSGEEWFSLAAQFLSDEKERRHPLRWLARLPHPVA